MVKVKIEIETQTFVRFVAVLIGTILSLALIWYLRSPLTLLLVSGFLALALNPPVNKIASLLPRHSRVGATTLSYLIVIGLIGGFTLLIVPPAVKQTVNLAQLIPSYIDRLQDQQGPAQQLVSRYGIEPQVDAAIENTKDQVDVFARNIGSAFLSSVTAIFSGLISLLTVLVVTFLMLIEGPSWMKKIWALYRGDKKRKRHQEVVTRMNKVVAGYINGQLLIALIAALSTLAVLLILTSFFNIPGSIVLPLSGLILITSMIPMVGATIGAVLVTIVLLFSDISGALIFLAYFVVYQQIENNVVQPAVQARTVELSALSVIVAVILGVSLMGLLGALLAIPVAGCLRVLINYRIERRNERLNSPAKETAGMVGKVKKAFK